MKRGKHIAILLMAAGGSSRMEGIKQLLPWNGTTLLLHALRTVLDVQTERVFMVLGANGELIRKASHMERYPVAIVMNKDWKDGLGSSIACGIKAILKQEADIDGILICLADQPLLTSTYYKELIRVFTSKEPPIVATKYPIKYGVPAIFNTQIAMELTHLKEDHGAKHMLLKYKEHLIALDAGEGIVDIDTPQTYALRYKQHNLSQE